MGVQGQAGSRRAYAYGPVDGLCDACGRTAAECRAGIRRPGRGVEMNSDQAFGLVYGVLLLVLVGSALVVRRMHYGPMIRMAITWALIFAAANFVAAPFGRSCLEIGVGSWRESVCRDM